MLIISHLIRIPDSCEPHHPHHPHEVLMSMMEEALSGRSVWVIVSSIRAVARGRRGSGELSAEDRKRGLSDEQVCVPCGLFVAYGALLTCFQIVFQ